MNIGATGKLKVLHIDDEPNQLHFAKLFLEKADASLEILPVSSYEELRSNLTPDVDCIISDYKMPVLNGVEICGLVKKVSDVPFILYTAHGSESVAETAIAAGVDDYIRKEMDPSHYKLLANRVLQAIEKHRSKMSNILYKKRLETLHKYAAEISKASEIDEIATLSFEAVKETLDFSFAGFHLLRGTDLIELFIMGAQVEEPYIQSLDGKGVTIRAIRTGATQVVRDTRLDGDYVSWPKGLELLSEVAVPFSVDGRVAGILNVESEKTDAFSKEDVALLEILGSYISSSVGRLRQIESYRESEARWKSYLESSMDAAFIFVGTEIAYANKRTADMLGYHDRSELIGLDSLTLVKEDERETVKSRMLGRQRGEDSVSRYDITLLDRSGREVTVETNASLVDYDGKNASLAYCRDISARKSYEKKLTALHKSAVRLGKSHSLEEVYDAILDTIESVLGFRFAGVAMYEDRHLRYTRTRGLPMQAEWVMPVSADSVTARTFRTRKAQLISDTRLDPNYIQPPPEFNMEIITLSELAVPINENSSTLGVINVESTEVSAFTAYDAELIEILAMHSASALRRIMERKELEHIIEQKTLETLEAEKLRAVGRIASMVAHDLRNPLQTIKNSVYFLGSDSEYVERINSSVDFCVKMLEDLKDYTSTLPMNTTVIALRDLVDQALKDVVIPPSVAIEVDLDEEVTMRLDYTKMRRVLNNVILNAVEAMPHGGTLKIIGERQGGSVQLRIADSGAGIPEEVLSRLFTDLVTTKENGNGLGLSYCKRIMEAHGGRIELSSKLSAGTEVRLVFPEHVDEPNVDYVAVQVPQRSP